MCQLDLNHPVQKSEIMSRTAEQETSQYLMIRLRVIPVRFKTHVYNYTYILYRNSQIFHSAYESLTLLDEIRKFHIICVEVCGLCIKLSEMRSKVGNLVDKVGSTGVVDVATL